MWEFYLSYCEAGFKSKNIDLIQFSFKINNNRRHMINFKILINFNNYFIFYSKLYKNNSMKPTDFKNTEPTMTIEEYFDGPVKAWGLLQDRSGKVTRQFKADMTGSFEGDILTLKEDFYWTDGEKQNRIWKIKKIDQNYYEGTAPDVVGTAKGYHMDQLLNLNMI